MKLLSLSGDLFGEGYDRPYEFALACENEVYIDIYQKRKSMKQIFLFVSLLLCLNVTAKEKFS